MAVMTINRRSPILNLETNFKVVMPDDVYDEDAKLLVLLHGFSDSCETWCRNSPVERYIADKNVIVIMPDGYVSFYSDMAQGLKYYSYMLEDLRTYCSKMLPISQKREDSFIAGLSMGGYGAFKIALKNPDLFCGAASFSGTLDIKRLSSLMKSELSMVYGSSRVPESEDLFSLATEVAESPVKPKLYQWCGFDDILYEDNVRFKEHVQPLGFDYTYSEGIGGHTWDKWDEQLKLAIDFFGI